MSAPYNVSMKQVSVFSCLTFWVISVIVLVDYISLSRVGLTLLSSQVDDSKYSFAADEQGFRHPPVGAAGAAVEEDEEAGEEGDGLDDSSGSEGFCDQEPRTRPAGVPDFGRRGAQAEAAGRDSDSSDEGIKVGQVIIIQ